MIATSEGSRVRIFRVDRFVEERPVMRSQSIRATRRAGDAPIARDDSFRDAAGAVSASALQRDHSLAPPRKDAAGAEPVRQDSFALLAASVEDENLSRSHSLRLRRLSTPSDEKAPKRARPQPQPSRSTSDPSMLRTLSAVSSSSDPEVDATQPMSPSEGEAPMDEREMDREIKAALRGSALEHFGVAEIRRVASFLPLEAKWPVCAACHTFHALVDAPDDELFLLGRSHSWAAVAVAFPASVAVPPALAALVPAAPSPWGELPPLDAVRAVCEAEVARLPKGSVLAVNYEACVGGLVLLQGSVAATAGGGCLERASFSGPGAHLAHGRPSLRGSPRLGVLRKGAAAACADLSQLPREAVIPGAGLSASQRNDVEVALAEVRPQWGPALRL